MVSTLRELFEPRKKDRSEPGELTLHHPQGRHGLYIRNDGVVDLQTRGSAVGVGPLGISLESPALYVGAGSVAFRSDRIGFQVPYDGYFLSGRRLNPQLVSGGQLLRPRADAKVLIVPGSIQGKDSASAPPQGMPYTAGGCVAEMVSLFDLVQPIAFTESVESASWIDEMIRVLARGLGDGGSDAGTG